MKIVIIGAGAMGCLYGAYLSEKNEVTMLDVYEPQCFIFCICMYYIGNFD